MIINLGIINGVIYKYAKFYYEILCIVVVDLKYAYLDLDMCKFCAA
jgi:hypothetical protein